ncbi:MAG: DUF2961 domain-containing protein [Bacteroidales bacterium]|nr:DUF2961 domain-containing protein [Bacteroidales bacterium]
MRIFYDGREEPDIEVPFGDFFANCFRHPSRDDFLK